MDYPTNQPDLNRAIKLGETSAGKDGFVSSSLNARAIAFYLPQYHPIPQNDAFWGKGFTEWTNVTKAKPLFSSHRQPNLPGELSFYDLRIPGVRQQQANLAQEAGVEAFCYWHYWFGNGQRALERIFDEVLDSGQPDFPFCLGWANETWTGRWHGLDSEVIFEQTYSTDDDHQRHMDFLTKAMADARYLRVNGRPLFLVYKPRSLPERYTDQLRRDLDDRGIEGVHLVAIVDTRGGETLPPGFDAFVRAAPMPIVGLIKSRLSRKVSRSMQKAFQMLGSMIKRDGSRRIQAVHRVNYRDYVQIVESAQLHDQEIPVVVPNWDNTPRTGRRGVVIENSSPELFGKHLETMVSKISSQNLEERLVFIKSWNEWAEGNYIEPDLTYGRAWIEQAASVLKTNTGIATGGLRQSQ